jgi:CHASE3 domain sensor protein
MSLSILTHKHIALNTIHTYINSMTKITIEQIQTLDKDEAEVYEAMKDLAELNTPHIALLNREMKRRGRSERSTNQIIETLSLLGKVMLGAGENEGRFEIVGA